MDAHNLSGRRVALERLHVTLHWLGDHEDVPQGLLRRAKSAGGSVEMAPFDVGFDRIGSLRGAGGLAMTGAAELKALRRFQRAVGMEMNAAGVGCYIRKKFSPHVSLLYCHQHLLPEPITPICWRVHELLLIDSFVGCGKHVVVGCWPLQGRQMNFGDW
ncbi:RNA 2',3'-cyclic phosphodiesterase [Variovorax sp. J22G73]|jgi:2'-5' RNA ligase|uniref:2'-5' RNA ligase family protein n=1 Tax=unclassified Variovorax TaxID=663243 RepID=UPI001051FB85|nr:MULTISPECIES: 2'-5' RNA ligase family protein [unclassified Variovorax]MDM0006535.1 RNA 2',3'-cyclic phosphodiesterase [Variovorax sp. J22R203]MDM0097441.1 RNA 2',3'-cyclic phosphodiesterase [Variovorax sp. J22G73]